ncbi:MULTISPECIES: transposase [Streptomyces]|uniref:Transposase IS204/IS1001/IS1096/IS1165 DDE domain-containing protein n=1 Tax=Streptomyces venezuelae TaxID=54571 RepID=A0A5P2B1A9_STRVZ|nr:transposase [Streptomyces venezuelae]QES24284.1 hypothetical protein DEJ46_38670 [Streptomyces venezuelae]
MQDALDCWSYWSLRRCRNGPPRVLGVDEFTFRKGHTYGTILVDPKASPVVDVLPGRTSETFATWLRDHPGAEIICRDGPRPTRER